MLELTRRMTPERTCFKRIAGAYMDRDGEIDNTFNINFLNLKGNDKKKNLNIAKAIPYSRTNEQIREYRFSPAHMGRNSFYQLLNVIRECGLKNDVLMETLYEEIGKYYETYADYAIAVFHGIYDVPMKATAGEYQYESEEIYDFMICAVCPLSGEYEFQRPDYGFLYPAFSYRSADTGAIDIFDRDPGSPQRALSGIILGHAI